MSITTMARPPQYKCAEVLQKATLLFWEKGYRGVSINDLVKATGLLPGSLYARFGSKEALFIECLEHYEAMADDIREKHAAADSPLARVRSLFEAMVDQAGEDTHHRGCFVVNAALECDDGEPKIKKTVRQCMEKGTAWMKQQLDDACAAGELLPDTDTTRMAACLMNAVYGFRVMSRAAETNARVEDIATTTFESLVKPWQSTAA